MKEAPLIPELYCTDFDKSIAFYKEILGFQILYSRPEDKFAKLDIEGAEIMLEQLEHEGGRRWLLGKIEHPFGRGVSFQIRVSNVAKIYQSLKENNIEPFLEMEEKWYRVDDHMVGNKQFVVPDPDGYLLRFFEDMGLKEIATA